MFRTLVAFTIVLASFTQANAGFYNIDVPIYKIGFFADTNRYPLWDRYGDPFSYPYRNSFDLSDTGFIKRSVEYDPVGNRYYIVE